MAGTYIAVLGMSRISAGEYPEGLSERQPRGSGGEGRTIARTSRGEAWCDNLERYSDYANRLPRGRTYVRNGSVVDLQIAAVKIRALVSGIGDA
jgi:hypothetical protein